MSEKQKGRGNPENQQASPIKHTLARGEYRAKTIARGPLQPGITLPPLPEDIRREESSERIIPHLFEIQIKPDVLSIFVTELLGQGAMGLVYKGYEQIEGVGGRKEIGSEVAVKIIHIDQKALGSDPEKKKKDLYENFRREVILLKKLKNEHIIQILDFGETNSPIDGKMVPYYTMDFHSGKDLEKILNAEKSLPWKRVRDLMLQVCDALSAAHSCTELGKSTPIIHRDIKPSNVLVTPGKRWKEKARLLDFGIAVMADTGKKKKQLEGIWGTLEYMSPEQAKGESADHRTDIYSVGSMMYHLLSGRTMFSQEGTVEDRLKRIIDDKPISLIGLGVDIPPEAERIIFKCLEKNPAKRYQNVGDLEADIENCVVKKEAQVKTAVVNVPISAEKTEIVQVEPARIATKSRKRILFGAIAAMGLAVLSGGILLSVKNKSKDENEHDVPITVRTSADASMKKPLSEPIIDNGIAPDTQEGELEFTIKLKTNIEGVEVLFGAEQICAPSEKSECAFKLPKSTNPVELTLRKKGFADSRIKVVPDMNKEVYLEMRRVSMKTSGLDRKKNKFLFESGKGKRVVPKKKQKFLFE